MIFISKRHLKWYTQDKTCSLMTLTQSLMSEKVSEILLTAWLESASILHRGQKITNYFVLTGFMAPLTSMITTARIMRINQVICIICFIPTVRVNFVQTSIQWICTPDSVTCNDTERLSKYFVRLCTIQLMNINRVFTELICKLQHILQKSHLVSIIYLYIVV